MAVVLYGLKTCDTCRKALKELKNNGHSVEFIDVRDPGVPEADLDRFIAEFDKDVINTRSTTWRGLSEEMRKKPALNLLLEHPTLMKRPVIEADGTLYLGWGKDVQAALLAG